MKVKASFVHLHAPLFFAGKNWGEKLDIKNTAKGKIELTYDREWKELELKCEGKVAYLPSTSVFSYEPLTISAVVEIEPTVSVPYVAPTTKAPRKSAQAQSPMDHVNQGLGAGRVRD